MVDACREIAKQSRLEDDEVRIVLLAAWFHDAAYAVVPDGDRKKGVELALTAVNLLVIFVAIYSMAPGPAEAA